MTNNSTQSSEESKYKCELEVLAPCLRFSLEPSILWINNVAHNYKAPHPWNGFYNGECIKWNAESLIISPSSLTFCWDVSVISRSQHTTAVQIGGKVHCPYWKHHVPSVMVNNMSYYYYKRWRHVWHHISWPLNILLDNQNISTYCHSFNKSSIFGVRELATLGICNFLW